MMNTTNNTEQCPQITKHPTVHYGRADAERRTKWWENVYLFVTIALIMDECTLCGAGQLRTHCSDNRLWQTNMIKTTHSTLILSSRNNQQRIFLFLISSRLCTVIVDSTWDRKSTKFQSSTLCETREASHCWSEVLLIKWTVILNQNNLNTRISV